MQKSIETRRLRDLIRLLSGLREMHEKLAGLGRAKLEAIRRADTEAMGDLIREEQDLARRIRQSEGLRRQLMDAIGESLELPPRTARALPVSQLSSRVAEPQRAMLQEAAEKLREAVSRVAQINRRLKAVSNEVLGHLERVLRTVSPAGEDPSGYCGAGKVVAGSDSRIFETVG